MNYCGNSGSWIIYYVIWAMKGGRKELIRTSPAEIWQEYQKGITYNNSLDLYETVRRNENFYLGRQWEGLNAPDLEKPVLNFLKRVVTYYISMLISDDLAVNVTPFAPSWVEGNSSVILPVAAGGENTEKLKVPGDLENWPQWQPEVQADKDYRGISERAADILSSEISRVMERNKLRSLGREALCNAAVDGDCCFYLHFMEDNTSAKRSEIAIELIENSNIFFGNPYVYDVQEQPYIIIARRLQLDVVRDKARQDGVIGWENIRPDDNYNYYDREEENNDDLVTVLLKMWKDPADGHIYFAKSTAGLVLKEPTDSGYQLYPVAYMSWERKKNSYHGQAALTQGVIQNQIYVNTLWALFMLHQKKSAFPKIFYDSTKVERWTNRVGQAIGVVGNPNEVVASAFRGADFAPQAMELVEKTISYTKEFMGATDAVLGNLRADNASAIISLQKASAAPLELQRLSYYQLMEDIVRIIVDIIRCDYGWRQICYKNDEGIRQLVWMNFDALLYDAMDINVEVGASSYWSELMQIETADNLLSKGVINDAVTYLESIPDRHVKDKDKIIRSLKLARAQAESSASAQSGCLNKSVATMGSTIRR